MRTVYSFPHGGATAVPSSGGDEASVNADIQAVFAPFIAANLPPTNAV